MWVPPSQHIHTSKVKKWPCQNLDYKILVTKQWRGPHWDGIPAPEMVCIVKTNKNGVRGLQASKSPAVWPPDPNLLAEPREADKPLWLQTVDSKWEIMQGPKQWLQRRWREEGKAVGRKLSKEAEMWGRQWQTKCFWAGGKQQENSALGYLGASAFLSSWKGN